MNNSLAWPVSFAEAFCAKYRCRAEAYETSVLWRYMVCRLSMLARMIDLARPDFFNDDREGIRRLASTRSAEEFVRELDDINYVARRQGGFLRLRAGLRLSVHRLDRLQTRLFP